MQYKKVLIGNDDGIFAHGIALLEELATKMFNNVIVVAPDSNKSGASHSLTLMTPLRASEISPNHYAITGSPVDCMIFGLRRLFDETDYPDLVLSGINNYSNVSEEVIYSGTIAIVREAALFGIPAVAFSQQHLLGQSICWDVARYYVPIVLKKILESFSFNHGTYLSVNFPAVNVEEVKGIKVVRQGIRKIKDRLSENIDPRGYPYYWVGIGEYQCDQDTDTCTDSRALNDGYITVVPLSVNMTDYSSLEQLRGICDEEFK